MLATCRATVSGLITSSSAMPRLVSPRAMRAAISCSRTVSTDGPSAPFAPPGPSAPPALAAPARAALVLAALAGSVPSLMASSLVIALPSASKAAAAAGPRRCRAASNRASILALAGTGETWPAASRRASPAPSGRVALGEREHAQGLQPAGDRQPPPSGEAELHALGQAGPGQLKVALGQRHPA